jgi:hypothetical protein
LKRLARGSALLAALVWLSSSACSLVVAPDDLSQGCAPGTKPCEVEPGQLRCVSTANPQYGCARDSCVPCTLSHAVEVCDLAGECAVGTCDAGYQNCDRIAKTGCEVDLDTSYESCGNCNTNCGDALRDMPRAQTAECQGSRCVVDTCKDGFADCDGAATNGCERALKPEDCGRCDGCPGVTRCNVDAQRCE